MSFFELGADALAQAADRAFVPNEAANVVSSEPNLSAQAAILIDAETGIVLWERNAHKRMFPASLTKMMTGLLAIESGRLEEYFIASARAAATGESTIHLKAGERLKLSEALEAALIKSANDATVFVAEAIGGSVPAFVEMMNRRAHAMGLMETHFVNPHGLHHVQHYSTAADLAEIARQSMQNPIFARLVATKEAIISWPGKPYGRKLINRNRLLLRWDKCDGIKTGYTKQAGRCLAASASQGDWRLIAVVLKCKDAWTDARRLIEWGWAHYERHAVVRTQDIYFVPVKRGARNVVSARPARNLYNIYPKARPAAAALHVNVHSHCKAPIEIGDIVGELIASNGASTALVAVESLPLSFWARITDLKIPQGGALLLVFWAAGVLLHGATAKIARARRRRLPTRKREAYTGRARYSRRPTRPFGDESRSPKANYRRRWPAS